MDAEPVTVATFEDYIKAEMARQLLEDNGIRAFVSGADLSNVFTGVPVVAHIELQCSQADAERAGEILASSREQG